MAIWEELYLPKGKVQVKYPIPIPIVQPEISVSVHFASLADSWLVTFGETRDDDDLNGALTCESARFRLWTAFEAHNIRYVFG
jgi:hypothetical protein